MRVSPKFEDLPIELQWRIEQDKRRREAIADWATAIFCLTCAATVTVPAINGVADRILSLPSSPAVKSEERSTVSQIDRKFLRPIELGERIGDLQVGRRGYFPCQKSDKSDCTRHPITGKIGSHRGIDLGAPQGRPQYVAGKGPISVTCNNQPNGAGLWAEITPFAPQGTVFRSFHLSSCTPGTYQPGQIFGATGSTGMSTGPHWHWEQKEGESWVHPQFAWLYQSVTGRLPE